MSRFLWFTVYNMTCITVRQSMMGNPTWDNYWHQHTWSVLVEVWILSSAF